MTSNTIKDFSTKYRTWVEIDSMSIEHNYKVFRSYIKKKTKLAVVVKSNAYGHDIVQFAHKMVSLGADVLAVDSVIEALSLRKNGINIPIFVLGYTLPVYISEAASKKIQITISSIESLREIQTQKLNKKLLIHIKVDTGMHRQGFLPEDEDGLFEELEKVEDAIEVEGLYTHFAAAKNPNGTNETKGQIKRFETWVEKFKKNGYRPTKHACATAGTLLYPNAHFNMVRVGLGMCGLWPSSDVREYCKDKIILKPALSWRTIISEIKQFKNGDKIGYDFSEEIKRDSFVAVCPVGYWHGYGREMSSIGQVLVGGERCKVLGRVSMDMIMIDITCIHTKVKVGDIVTLLGLNGQNKISAEEIAEILHTINYEVVTRINPRIKRVFLN